MKKSIYTLLMLALALSMTLPALAVTSVLDKATDGLQGTIDQAYGGGEVVEVDGDTFNNGVISIINALLTFTGVIFLLILIYAGWLWMTARGNEEQITRAKDIMRNVIIGLVVILMARLITELILSQLSSALETPPPPPPNA